MQFKTNQAKPKSSATKAVPTFTEQQLEIVTREAARDLDAAWTVINMFDKSESLQTQYPMLYLRAKRRIARNQNCYRVGRVLGSMWRVLRLTTEKLYRQVKQHAENRHMKAKVLAEWKQQNGVAVDPTPSTPGITRQRNADAVSARHRARATQLKQRAVSAQSYLFGPLGIS